MSDEKEFTVEEKHLLAASVYEAVEKLNVAIKDSIRAGLAQVFLPIPNAKEKPAGKTSGDKETN